MEPKRQQQMINGWKGGHTEARKLWLIFCRGTDPADFVYF